MAGRNTLPTTAAGVIDNIKQTWHLTVVVIAADRSVCNFGGTLTKRATKGSGSQPFEEYERIPIWKKERSQTAVRYPRRKQVS